MTRRKVTLGREQIPALFMPAWEQRKLGDLVTIERGGSPRPIESYITDAPDGLNWVKIGDAPEMGRYITSTEEKIKPEGLAKTRQVYPGDLILSNSMSFGRPYIMAVEGCIHDGWLLIRDRENRFEPQYLCHMLGTPEMLNQYRTFAAGSTVNNLNKELVGNARVPVPDKREQTRIGSFLDQLDNLITLHQREHLQQTAPKHIAIGASAWEQRKLGDIAGRFDNLRIPVAEKDRVPGTTPYYGANGIQDYIDGYTHDGEYVLIAEDGASDLNNYPVQLINGLSWVNNHAHVIQGLPNIASNEYLLHAIHSLDIAAFLTGGTRAKLNAEVMMGLEIPIPDYKEQVALGSFLSQLDNLITLHQRELNYEGS